MSSKGGYCVGGFQEGSGNLKGLCGVVESSSLKKCRRLRDLLWFWNLRRIDVGVEGAERGINLRPRLRSFVSNRFVFRWKWRGRMMVKVCLGLKWGGSCVAEL